MHESNIVFMIKQLPTGITIFQLLIYATDEIFSAIQKISQTYKLTPSVRL